MPRQLKPPQPVTVSAAYVSQLTCLPLLGIDARRYLEQLVPRCKGDVVPMGKLRLVPIDIAVLRLRELAEPSGRDQQETSGDPEVDATTLDQEDSSDDDQPASVDDVLRRIGKERIR